MTVKTDNPAGRLHAVLTKFYEHPEKIRQGSATDAIPSYREALIRDRISTALDIPNNPRSLMFGLLEIHKMIDDLELILSSKEGINEILYLEPLRRIRNAFSIIDMQITWDRSKSHPTVEKDLTSLMFISELLSQSQPEKVVPEEEVSKLQEELEALVKLVLSSSLSSEIKAVILSQLEAIRRALFNYRMRGFPTLQEAMEKVAGSYFVNEKTIDTVGDKEEVKAYKGFLSKFVATVSFAANVTKLIDAAAKWLPLLSSGNPPDVPPPAM